MIDNGMTPEEKLNRLDELRNELFLLANSYAGDETGPIAGHLHESANQILYAMRMAEHGVTDEDRAMSFKMAVMRQNMELAAIMAQYPPDEEDE